MLVLDEWADAFDISLPVPFQFMNVNFLCSLINIIELMALSKSTDKYGHLDESFHFLQNKYV
jgi:hypothetical protein